MKKIMKRSLAMVLVLVALLPILSMTALAAPKAPKSVTVYLDSAGEYPWAYFYVDVPGLKGSQRIKSVKSSDTSIAEWSKTDYSNRASKYTPVSGKKSSYNYRYDSFSGYAHKPGTATMTYKIGSTTYATKVVVKKYVNPVKTLTISGVNGGKNMASLFKTESYASGAKLSSASSGKLTLKAASGWVIVSVNLHKGGEMSKYQTFAKGVGSTTMNIGKVSAGKDISVYATLMNKTTKGTIDISLNTYNY